MENSAECTSVGSFESLQQVYDDNSSIGSDASIRLQQPYDVGSIQSWRSETGSERLLLTESLESLQAVPTENREEENEVLLPMDLQVNIQIESDEDNPNLSQVQIESLEEIEDVRRQTNSSLVTAQSVSIPVDTKSQPTVDTNQAPRAEVPEVMDLPTWLGMMLIIVAFFAAGAIKIPSLTQSMLDVYEISADMAFLDYALNVTLLPTCLGCCMAGWALNKHNKLIKLIDQDSRGWMISAWLILNVRSYVWALKIWAFLFMSEYRYFQSWSMLATSGKLYSQTIIIGSFFCQILCAAPLIGISEDHLKSMKVSQ